MRSGNLMQDARYITYSIVFNWGEQKKKERKPILTWKNCHYSR
jgi:hypothetical protein